MYFAEVNEKSKKFLVYRSSAGSGKTFTLVKEYLAILLQKDSVFSFKHILAITFTNKAANEMKERVLHTLHSFAGDKLLEGGEKTMMDILKKELIKGEEYIREKSREIVTAVLHNYGDFNITTIDKFMLKVVRAFAHDLKLPINFEIELDDKTLVSNAVDQLLMKVGENEELTTALIKYSKHQTEEEESWNIETRLKEIAPQLLKEQGYRHIQKLKTFTLAHFIEQNKLLTESIKSYENKQTKIAKEALAKIASKGLSGDEFTGGKNGLLSALNKSKQKDFKKFRESAGVKNVLSENWYKKGIGKGEQQKIEAIQVDLSSLINQSVELYDQENGAYELNVLISKNLFALALLNEIEKIIDDLRNERNFVHISEFNKRILDIVLSQPIPFVYERIGERFQHYLIDEFQDTSILQWQNILPLIDNSLASGHQNLLVGDAKQAIYRFRGGDVEQFAKMGDAALQHDNPLIQERVDAINRNFEEKILNENYRSTKNIIQFNNGFFEKVKNILPAHLQEYYKDYFQKNSFAKEGGFVHAEQILASKNNEFHTEVMQHIQGVIADCLQRGYKYSDIAILTRKNSIASNIADELMSMGIPVVSSESLLLHKNPHVDLLISLLQLAFQNQNKAALIKVIRGLHNNGSLGIDFHEELEKYSLHPALLLQTLQEKGVSIHDLSHISLYEMVQLWALKLHIPIANNYLIQFFDMVSSFGVQNGPDLGRFLEWWNENHTKFSVQISEDENAVKLSSIHKAKGLEYPIVILPFNAQNIFSSERDHIWIDNKNEELPTAYINLNKSLEGTDFSKEYEEERNKILLDTINVLYVAFTRPKNEMYIYTVKAKGENFNTVQDILTLLFEGESVVYEEGTKGIKKAEETINDESYHPQINHHSNWREKVQISKQAPTIWDGVSPKEYGNIIHTLLAKLNYASELDKVLKNAYAEGLINEDQVLSLKEKIENIITKKEIAFLFEPGITIKQEQEIISEKGEFSRPDRVVEKNGELFIIDFKTGEESEKHRRQLEKYEVLLFQIHGKKATRYLFYIEKNKIITL